MTRLAPWFLAVAAAGVLSSGAGPVMVRYKAEIQTVTGTPFGFDVGDIGGTVAGFFTWDSSTADIDDREQFGRYPHGDGGAFLAILPDGREVRGSSTPFADVDDIGTSDTFRFKDGPAPELQGGPMTLDGVVDTGIGVFIAMTSLTGSVWDSDAIPTEYPFVGNPFPPQSVVSHTFLLRDGGFTDQLSMQFRWLLQPPGTIPLTIGRSGTVVTLRWPSVPDVFYRVESSLDGVRWDPVDIAIPGPEAGSEVVWMEDLVVRFVGEDIPDQLLYRVVRP